MLPTRRGAQEMFTGRVTSCSLLMTSIDSAPACLHSSKVAVHHAFLGDVFLLHNFRLPTLSKQFTIEVYSYFFCSFCSWTFSCLGLPMGIEWSWMTGWWAGLVIVTTFLARSLHRVISKICRPRDEQRSGILQDLTPARKDAKFESVESDRSK